MDASDLHVALQPITAQLAGRALDRELQDWLNATYPADGEVFAQVRAVCQAGVGDGWLCQREAGGIRFGRVFKPDLALQGFSVDVVSMTDVVGPYHVHPNGEIDLIMPLDAHARFDSHGAGWLVYPPGSAHPPTVAGGTALVLYLLPAGAIEFTRA